MTDKIKLSIEKNAILEQAVQSNEQYIKNETLTTELQFVNSLEKGTEIAFDEIETKILIEKI